MSLNSKLQNFNRVRSVISTNKAIIIFIKRLLKINRPTRVLISKYNISVFVRPCTDDIWVLWQVFGSGEYQQALLFNAKNILDLGANCGYASIYLSHAHPNSKIIAIEPDIENFAALQMNVAPYSAIVPIHAGVSCQDGLLVESSDLTSSAKQFDFLEITEKPNLQKQKYIESYSIKTLSENHSVRKWDLIKMDIEGAEYQMLDQAHTWIGLTERLAVEIHSWCHEKCQIILDDLKPHIHSELHDSETHWIVFK